ncbi:hypothetical protein [Pareuzebyella sediminis]|uniref:hypothetical protein n=1 Tax=Pareuzebyella sediminis TaxID=2607998 RepID=UPI0018E0FD64|nr:hypothetical protein [Pareuzebyella sediminis]
MSGLFESHFMDIVSFIEENCKVVPHKESGAIASLSIGGFQIMQSVGITQIPSIGWSYFTLPVYLLKMLPTKSIGLLIRPIKCK